MSVEEQKAAMARIMGHFRRTMKEAALRYARGSMPANSGSHAELSIAALLGAACDIAAGAQKTEFLVLMFAQLTGAELAVDGEPVATDAPPRSLN